MPCTHIDTQEAAVGRGQRRAGLVHSKWSEATGPAPLATAHSGTCAGMMVRADTYSTVQCSVPVSTDWTNRQNTARRDLFSRLDIIQIISNEIVLHPFLVQITKPTHQTVSKHGALGRRDDRPALASGKRTLVLQFCMTFTIGSFPFDQPASDRREAQAPTSGRKGAGSSGHFGSFRGHRTNGRRGFLLARPRVAPLSPTVPAASARVSDRLVVLDRPPPFVVIEL